MILSLPRLGNPFLSQAAYSILSDLLSSPTDGNEADVVPEIPNILKAVLSSPPSKTDATLAPAWLLVLGNAILALKEADPELSAAELGKAWKAMWSFLESSNASVRKAAALSLALLSQCFTPSFITPAMQEHGKGEPKSALGKIIVQTDKAFDSLAFARSMPELLSVISSLVANLRYRERPLAPTAAQILLLSLIEKIGHARIQKGFEFKEAADGTLGVAMSVLGPEVLLHALPLNLEPADR